MTTFEATIGVAVSIPVWDLAGGEDEIGAFPPAGVDPKPPGLVDDETLKRLVGTPTELGEWIVRQLVQGSYGSAPRGLPVTITVVESVPDPEPDPDPDPEPDPWDEWDELADRLAPRVAAFVGMPDDPDVTATALAQLPVVAEYIRGYTRGHGFETTIPAPALRAVMVSGTARLATNPEQVSVFTTGDYSERPAQLAGWTLTELGVLRRYRRTSA